MTLKMCYWHAIVQTKHQQRFMVNVWAGIIGNHLIGPFFFEDRLNGAMYLQFLQQSLNGLLENVPLEIRNQMWFMHDGAPPHFSNLVRQHLSNTFGCRWIGRGGPILWPPRSPDIFMGKFKEACVFDGSSHQGRPDRKNKTPFRRNSSQSGDVVSSTTRKHP